MKENMMSKLLVFWRFSWHSILVALGYLAGLILAGMIGGMLGVKLSTDADRSSSFANLFVASLLLGVFLGPFASRLALSRGQHFLLWGSLVLFNIGSVAIEGAYFAPDLVSIPVPMLVGQQLLATVGAAFVITRLFTTPRQSGSWLHALRTRPWYAWLWRYLASAMSYLVFYFVFGGLNYQLVTKPYYESHAGGLTIPAPETVFIIESIRGLMIVFSVFLFLLSIRGTRHQLMVNTGWLLFAIGGIIPLIWQIGTLPLFLLAASGLEIFFQNFLTGIVAAQLLGIEDTD
jgi:hypothetical protein